MSEETTRRLNAHVNIIAAVSWQQDSRNLNRHTLPIKADLKGLYKKLENFKSGSRRHFKNTFLIWYCECNIVFDKSQTN
jgi:hypothetical protein